ncbi:MAG: Hsp20/alpha crystallin family protein [Planctomycetota bacterium]|nr:MAG: Hsp20/alpha crystallin family protein [Planctomycetota bacterium]
MANQGRTEMATTGGAQAVTAERSEARPVLAPAVDVYETSDNLYIYADLPGVSDKDLELTFDEGVLTIEASQQIETPQGFELARAEFQPVDFQRSFRLREPVDESKIDARLKDGVLTLVLPKAKPSARRITVKTE